MKARNHITDDQREVILKNYMVLELKEIAKKIGVAESSIGSIIKKTPLEEIMRKSDYFKKPAEVEVKGKYIESKCFDKKTAYASENDLMDGLPVYTVDSLHSEELMIYKKLQTSNNRAYE